MEAHLASSVKCGNALTCDLGPSAQHPHRNRKGPLPDQKVLMHGVHVNEFWLNFRGVTALVAGHILGARSRHAGTVLGPNGEGH